MPDPSLFTSVINSYLPEPHASLLNGILFGTHLSKTLTFYERIKRVGLLHIVVLSGMNITILGTIIGSLTYALDKRISVIVSIIGIVCFTVFVGPQAPIIRASCMGVLTLIAVLLGRKALPLYLLFLSGFLTFLVWPKWVRGLSFQLSYAATLGILLFGITYKHTGGTFSGKMRSLVWRELKPSLAAQAFTVPIIFLHFKEVSFMAPLSNLLVSFTIAPLMVFGFLTAVLGKIHMALGLLPAIVCHLLLSYIYFIIEILSSVPFAYVKF